MENEEPREELQYKDDAGLSNYVMDLFQEFKNSRRPYEGKATEWWNNFLSQYQVEKRWRTKEGEGNRSRIFVKVTQQKCYTAHAKTMDAVGTEIPFDFEPLDNLNYADIPPEIVTAAIQYRKKYISDYLKFVKAIDAIDDIVLSATIMPAAILKGPIRIVERQAVVKRRMIMGMPAEQVSPDIPPYMIVMEPVEKFIFEEVPFWDYYVDCNVKKTKQSIGEIHYKRMSKQEFRDLMDDPGYDVDQMKAAIRSIDTLSSSLPDSDNDKTQEQLGDNFNGYEAIKDNKIPVIEFQGLVPVSKLREFGGPQAVPENIPDHEDVEAIISVVAADNTPVIKAQFNYFGYRQFMVVGVKKIPNTIYKNSTAGLMDDSQSVINSSTRILIDNKALSGNGCIWVNKDKIDWMRTGSAEVYPRKTFFGKDGATMNESIGSITFPDVSMGLKDLTMMFMQIADEETGIPKYSQGDMSGGNFLNKMLDINTPVPMADGSWKLLADIVDGDKIIGRDGGITTVVKAHEIHYPERAYQIKFHSGEVIRAGGEHLWTVVKNGSEKIINTDKMFEEINSNKKILSIPRVARPKFGSNKRLPLDPYILGLWLGDGHSYGARITTQDEEVVESLREWCKVNGGEVVVDKTQNSGKATTYYIRGDKKDRRGKDGRYAAFSESLHGRLRLLGLCKRTDKIEEGVGKHIPEEYLQASYEDRLALLRGLMDTDGCHHSYSLNIFIQKEGRLVEDVIRLITGLGGFPRVHKTNPGAWANPGVSYYQIHFSMADNPFKMKKKASKWKPMARKCNTQKIESIEMVDICKMRCLTVDAPDGLFCVGEKFTVTHNTATGISMIMGASNVNLKPFLRNLDESVFEPMVERLDALFSMLGKYPAQFNIPLKIRATGTVSLIARELIVENAIKLLQITGTNPQDATIVKRRELLKDIADNLGLSKFTNSDQEMQKIEMMLMQQQSKMKSEPKVDVDKLFPYMSRIEQAQILESIGIKPDPNYIPPPPAAPAGGKSPQASAPQPVAPAGMHYMADGSLMADSAMPGGQEPM